MNHVQQLYPRPHTDPGFRVGLDGRAVFAHQGFRVDVLVRYATTADGQSPEPGDVIVTGSITLEDVRLCTETEWANEGDAFAMVEALREVLERSVTTARRKASLLLAHVQRIDQRNLDAAQAGHERWPSVGEAIIVQDLPTTDAERELWSVRQPPMREGEVVESPAAGHSYLTIDCGGPWGMISYPPDDFCQRYAWKPAWMEEAP
jgi:hypothetical protein